MFSHFFSIKSQIGEMKTVDMESFEKISKLRKIIEESKKIVFFGGAGVSTESGIPDFRSANGIYSQKLNRHFSPEELISHTMYLKYPEDFYDFYKKNLIYKEAKPNFAHFYLAKLEKEGKLSAVVTQNIDCLHEMAGSKNVLKVHGTIDRNICTKCGKVYNLDEFLSFCEKGKIPHCPDCGGVIKPDVTLYEEGLNMEVFSEAIRQISNADTLIIGGTSLIVHPAASLIQYFNGKNLVLINKSSTDKDYLANLVIHDKIGEVFKKL